MANIKIEGMDELLKKLDAIPAIQAAVKSAAIYVKGKIAKYPPSPKSQGVTRAGVYGSSFASDKQRRWFFANLRDGSLDVPYRRGYSGSSEALGRSWTKKYFNNGLSAHVGNDSTYGALVQDREQQSLFHKATGWLTAQDVEEKESDAVNDIIRDYLEAHLDGTEKQSTNDND